MNESVALEECLFQLYELDLRMVAHVTINMLVQLAFKCVNNLILVAAVLLVLFYYELKVIFDTI